MNIDTSKSYSSEKNLMKALQDLGLTDHNPIIVRNRKGRYTAIFGYSLSNHKFPIAICRAGFSVIN